MLVAFSTLIFLASLGFSQGTVRSFRWWLDPDVRRELALTGKQVADIETEFGRTLNYRLVLRQKFDTANAELARAFATGDLSDAAAEVLVSRVENLRRQRNVARVQLLVVIYFRLTPEQRARLPDVVERTIFGTRGPC